jgi:hypothetical protein
MFRLFRSRPITHEEPIASIHRKGDNPMMNLMRRAALAALAGVALMAAPAARAQQGTVQDPPPLPDPVGYADHRFFDGDTGVHIAIVDPATGAFAGVWQMWVGRTDGVLVNLWLDAVGKIDPKGGITFIAGGPRSDRSVEFGGTFSRDTSPQNWGRLRLAGRYTFFDRSTFETSPPFGFSGIDY